MWRSLVAPNRYKVIIRTFKPNKQARNEQEKRIFFLMNTWQPVEKKLPWGTFRLQCCHCVLFFRKFLLTEEQRPGSGPKDKVRDVWYLYVCFFFGNTMKLNDFFWYISITSKHGQACQRADFIINAFDPRVY